MPTRHAFTLVEILVTVAILSILTAISYPFYADAHIRTQVLKVRTDYERISQALHTYFLDYHAYPYLRYDLGGRYPIFMAYELHPYLVPLPRNPWTGKMTYLPSYRDGVIIEMSSRRQFDYWINTYNEVTDPFFYNIPRPAWYIQSGGPVSESVGPDPRTWYSPTNGTLSFGGFWMDSINVTNVR